jgi:hypothetical protein
LLRIEQEYELLYQRWGEGNIGIIVAGNLMLRYDMVEAYGNPILPDNHDGRVEAFKKVSQVAKAHGSLFIAQLSMPGRQGPATLNPNPVSASDVQLKLAWAGNWFAQPRALTVPEIKDIVKQWVSLMDMSPVIEFAYTYHNYREKWHIYATKLVWTEYKYTARTAIYSLSSSRSQPTNVRTSMVGALRTAVASSLRS